MPDTLVACPRCNASLKLKSPGKKARCPKCSAVFSLPALREVLAAALRTTPSGAEPSAADAEVRPETASDHDDPAHVTREPTSVDRYRTVDSTEQVVGSPLRPPQLADELGRLGPYRVLKKLGEGGMGMVYQAEDVRLKRHIALKVMRPEHAVNAKARQRFLREAQTQAAIEHDHIVTIHQADEDAGVPFIAMPLLKGETLSDELKRVGRLPLADVLRIGRETAEGLSAAHERGLIHRDIKPSNLWLEGKRRRVKILDFGLARAVEAADDPHLTGSGVAIGTPAYMAPEQARGETVDARSDLFSLGCVLYQMTTGTLPFQGSTMMAVFNALATTTPKPAREVVPDLPAGLSELIEKLLAKDSQERPADAQMVAETLAAVERSLAPMTMLAAPAFTVLPLGEAAGSAPKEAAPATDPALTPMPAAAAPPTPPCESPVVPAPGPLRRLPIIGIAIAAAVLLGVCGGGGTVLYQVIIVRDKDGKKIAEIPQPKNGTLEYEKDGKKNVIPLPGPKDAWKPAGPWKPIAAGQSPLDKLDAAQIPAADRFPWQPKELVAVVGDHRQLHFSTAVGIAVTADRKRVISCSNIETCLWDAATMNRLATIEGVGAEQPGLTFDGQTLAMGGRLWDISGDQFKELATMEPNPNATSYAFAAGDRVLATGGHGEAVVKLWSWADGKLTETATLKGHQALTVNSLAFTPDGKTLISGDVAGEVRIWDLSGAKPTEKAVLKDSYSPALSLDGRMLATTTAKHEGVRLWDLAKLDRARGTIPMPGASGVCLAPDGKSLAVFRNDLTLFEIWPADVEAREPLVTGLRCSGYGMAFARDGKSLYATFGNAVLAIDVAPAKCSLRHPIRFPHVGVFPSAFTPDGRSLVTSNNGFTWWNLTGPRPVERSPDPRSLTSMMPERVWYYGISADSRRIAVGSAGTIRIRILEWADKQFRVVSQLDNWPFGPAVLAPDGQTLAAIADGKEIVLWDASDAPGREIARLKGHTGPITQFFFTPDSRGLVAASSDKTIRLWRLVGKSWKETAAIRDLPDIPLPFALSAQGDLLGAGLQSAGVVKIWEIQDAALKERGVLDKVWARGLTFLPDGKTLATGSADGAIQLWDWQRGEVSRTMQVRGDLLYALAAAPDGRHLAVRCGAGAVYILRLSEGVAGMAASAADDRAVAEMVIRKGGKVHIGTAELSSLPLPPGEFSIHRVDLHSKTVDDDDMRSIGALKSLHTLWVSTCPKITDVGVRHLANCKTLQVLDLRETSATPQCLEVLANLPELTSLHCLYGVTNESLAKLAGLKKLYSISAAQCSVTDDGLEVLTRMPSVIAVNFTGANGITDRGAEILARMKQLQYIDLSSTGVTGKGWQILAKLPKLANVTRPSDSVEFLRAMAGVKTLRQIDRYTNGAHLELFKGHPSLETLELNDPGIGDDRIAIVATLMNLRNLNIKGSKITPAGFQKLSAALPKCRIVSDHGTFEPK